MDLGCGFKSLKYEFIIPEFAFFLFFNQNACGLVQRETRVFSLKVSTCVLVEESVLKAGMLDRFEPAPGEKILIKITKQ